MTYTENDVSGLRDQLAKLQAEEEQLKLDEIKRAKDLETQDTGDKVKAEIEATQARINSLKAAANGGFIKTESAPVNTPDAGNEVSESDVSYPGFSES